MWTMDFRKISIVFSICICLQLALASAKEERKRVVIVGAGASGIAAATRLYENGTKDILVLEANETRIGGRVSTVDLKSNTRSDLKAYKWLYQSYIDGRIEMGAQFIHGEEENVVHKLASSRHLTCLSYDPTRTTRKELRFVRSRGESVRSDLAHKMIEIRDRVLGDPGENATSFDNCGKFYLELFKTEIIENGILGIPKDMKLEFVELFHQTKNTDVATDTWFNLSVSTFHEYELLGGNQAIRWCYVGYRKLFDILMEKSQEMSNGTFQSDVIALNTTVERIFLDYDKQNSSVIVECTDGRRIHADHVIVTVSLGALKESHSKLFENGTIPKLKIDTIENLEFGTVDKIFIEYAKPWWPENITGYQFLWMEKDRNEYRKKGLGWVVGLYAVAVVDFAENLLCGWISGAEARAMESLDEKVVRDTVVEVLNKFLWNRTSPLPEPTRIIRSQWYSNKYFRGSYSYRSPRTDAANVSSHTLSIPVNNTQNTPIILFAGEATSEHHYSTVHGAVESGWREADRLIEFFTPKHH